MGDVAGDAQLVDDGGIAAAGGDPLPDALQLPDLDAFRDSARGRLLPAGRGLDANAGLCLDHRWFLPPPWTDYRWTLAIRSIANL